MSVGDHGAYEDHGAPRPIVSIVGGIQERRRRGVFVLDNAIVPTVVNKSVLST